MVMLPLSAALAPALLMMFAELLHARRIARMQTLLFNQRVRRRSWVGWVPLVRVVSAGIMMWGLVTLAIVPPRALTSVSGQEQSQAQQANLRRIIILLDVSPSMRINDIGDKQPMSRAQKAGEAITHMLSRINTDEVRVSVYAFYTDVKPVVQDTVDMEVVRGVVSGLPLDNAFEDGKTDLMGAVTKIFDVMKDWVADSTTLIIVSDGDTVPSSGLPRPPRALIRTLVIGLGNTSQGTFIDDHFSAQNAHGLQQLATRLGGTYQDSTAGEIRSDLLESISGKIGQRLPFRFGIAEWALCAIVSGGLALALISPMLAYFGVQHTEKRFRASTVAGHRGVSPSALVEAP